MNMADRMEPGCGCIVWEYELDVPNYFAPYQSEISNFIEEKFQSGKNVVRLRDVDPKLRFYEVNTQEPRYQKNVNSGFKRKILRNIYQDGSLVSKSVIWEWSSNKGWAAYNLAVGEAIESAYQSGSDSFDLESTFLKKPNIIYFSKSLQQNKRTKFTRQIERRTLLVSYKRGGSKSGTKSVPVENDEFDSPRSTNYKAPIPARGSDKQNRNQDLGAASSAQDNYSQPSSTGANNDIRKTLRKYVEVCTVVPDEDCRICLGNLREKTIFQTSSSSSSTVIILPECKHHFHAECLNKWIESKNSYNGFQCPCCKKIYGINTGDQPQGQMSVARETYSLPGFDRCGTIVITYEFSYGIQGPEHPNPGRPYKVIGFPRTCFLPDNTEGRKVLKLLQKAWDRRLIFTIATSVTMGSQDCVVWNGIHHKTERLGNRSGHGFPDPNYLTNVTEELQSHGVVDSDDEM